MRKLAVILMLTAIGCGDSPTAPDVPPPAPVPIPDPTPPPIPVPAPGEASEPEATSDCVTISVAKRRSLESMSVAGLVFTGTVFAEDANGNTLYVRVWLNERHGTKLGDFDVNTPFSIELPVGTHRLVFDVEHDGNRNGQADYQCDGLNTTVTISLPPPPPPPTPPPSCEEDCDPPPGCDPPFTSDTFLDVTGTHIRAGYTGNNEGEWTLTLYAGSRQRPKRYRKASDSGNTECGESDSLKISYRHRGHGSCLWTLNATGPGFNNERVVLDRCGDDHESQ